MIFLRQGRERGESKGLELFEWYTKITVTSPYLLCKW